VATQLPIFDQALYGSGNANADLWVNLGVIPNGQTIQLGYATFMAVDKNMQFELRSNTAGFSDGTTAHTQLHDWSGASSGAAVDRDFYQYGNLNTVTIQGTGTEHWWLHVTSQSSSSGGYAYIIRYTLQ